jgi:hypothetical protein
MTHRNDPNPLKWARAVGALYLVLLILGPFSLLYVPTVLIEPGDAAATAGNVAANELLYRLGIAGAAIIFMVDVVIAVLLYALFRPAGQVLSLVAFGGRLAMATLHGVMLIMHLLILLLVSDSAYLGGVGRDEADALTLLVLNLHQRSGIVWGWPFAVHCISIGLLAYRSSFVPSVLGLLILATGIGYLINSFGLLLLPEYAVVFAVVVAIGTLGELAFAFWLLIKGVNVVAWHELRASGDAGRERDVALQITPRRGPSIRESE